MKKTDNKKPQFNQEQVLCVLALTGKVGKSTIFNNLLAPRFPSARQFRMETINLSGHSDAEIMELKGKDFVKLQNELSKTNSALIDIGASNIESFLLSMSQQPGSHEAYDCFLIPVEASGAKSDAIDEFIKMVGILNQLGVEPERIKVVFNKLAVDADIAYEVRKIIRFHEIEGWFTLDLRAVIHESPAFAAISEIDKSYSSMLEDTTNYRQEFRNTPPTEDARRLELTKLMRAQSAVKPVQQEFDAAFEALFGG
jgi:hypothetical protein